jgi:hypothetical protein
MVSVLQSNRQYGILATPPFFYTPLNVLFFQLTLLATLAVGKDFTKGNPGLDYKGEESCLPSTTTYIFVNHLTLICA